jgi:hypothetical protein
MTRKASAVLAKIYKEAARRNVRIEITESTNIYAKDGGSAISGIFIPPKRGGQGVIRVAKGSRNFYEFMLCISHEFIHMRQYFNGEDIYYSSNYYKLEKNTELRAISFMKRNGMSQTFLKRVKSYSDRYLNNLKNGLVEC